MMTSENGFRHPEQPRRLTVRTLFALAALMLSASVFSADLTVVNSCSYTVFPGIFPAVFENGGWEMAPGTSVTFSLADGFIGRLWGRTGCDSSSPALCTTGQCGGTGLQCAGTTGVAGTSLAEFNVDASGTDWYDVSYVDGFDNPIGLSVSNSSCNSPNTCTTLPVTSCSSDLKSGADCLSPCTKFNTDQFCCRGAFGTSATCIVGNWPAAEQTYVTNIHNACPNEYSYPYDDNIGLHTCPTGANYTVTFCPGSANVNLNGTHTLAPQNETGSRLDDLFSSTASGNTIDVWPANGTGAQSWAFSNANVVPAGNYNFAVSYGPFCATASGSSSGSAVTLQPCNGSSGQSWSAAPAAGGYVLRPATNTSLCLDEGGAAAGAPTVVATCDGASSQSWAIN
jgi:hypothetical protein